ncbi:hypothetical protein Q4Q39_08240 [Flavivirga amylovorans]|uniref:Glycoside hydrolase n=1 Tax=Flavivirga amylovorans TaxID=870486 RepID=A0ABT8X0C0_9FLAO|nr:hypothetical protein [Flavivirga amylovorans]MDO5987381.1 hypothetical protein [Flavivirga amylovorans]
MKRLLIFCIAIAFFSCEKDDDGFPKDCLTEKISTNDKINGGSILQVYRLRIDGKIIDLAQKTNINWVTLSPLVQLEKLCDNHPCFDINDEVELMKVVIPNMIQSGINNIMLKPLTSFWTVNGSGFWGDFYVNTEEEWKPIEKTYTELFYEFAKLSEEFPEVKLLSIGNELKEFTKRRPQFFKTLITSIRKDFPNIKLTYSANWDEYQSVSFWEDLDYIGVNSYFPLVNKETPTVNEIKQAFNPIKNNLKDLSCTYDKPILFTEYGYRSIDYAAWKAWLLGNVSNTNHNFEAQNRGYTAFYDTFWDEDWVAGGFFWEWKILSNEEINNPNENGWYVNDKPVEEIIKERYSK